MSPDDNERMGSLIPHATVKICENGSHCSMYDDQENYFEALHRFLDDVEAKKLEEKSSEKVFFF